MAAENEDLGGGYDSSSKMDEELDDEEAKQRETSLPFTVLSFHALEAALRIITIGGSWQTLD